MNNKINKKVFFKVWGVLINQRYRLQEVCGYNEAAVVPLAADFWENYLNELTQTIEKPRIYSHKPFKRLL